MESMDMAKRPHTERQPVLSARACTRFPTRSLLRGVHNSSLTYDSCTPATGDGVESACRHAHSKCFRDSIGYSMHGRFLERDPVWTDNIAGGSELFVKDVAERIRNRTDLDINPSSDGTWTVRERESAYD